MSARRVVAVPGIAGAVCPLVVRSRVLLRHALVVALMLAIAVPAASSAQGRRGTPREQFFNVRWDVEREEGRDIAIVGSFDNHYLYPVTDVLLQIQVLDPRGQVTQESFGPLGRTVPAGGRVTFRVPLPGEGSQYAVLVHGFQFAPGESP